MLKPINPESVERICCLIVGRYGLGKTSLIRTVLGQEYIDGQWVQTSENGEKACVLSAESGLLAVRDLVKAGMVEGYEIGSLAEFKEEIRSYTRDPEISEYFKDSPKGKIILFGKSMNTIDLPFLNRDLGWDFMREHFHHQVLDLSSVAFSLIDLGLLPKECATGSGMMKYLSMGDVAHTALEDAVNTARMYLDILKKHKKTSV